MWNKLLFLISVVSTGKVLFELMPYYKGHEEFQKVIRESILETLSDVSRPDECANHCVKHPNCSAFGYNVNSNICQLLGDLMIPKKSLEPRWDDQRYYFIRKEWCDLDQRYIFFRGTGLCLRWSVSKRDSNDAQTNCKNRGGRLAVLNSEEKRDAVFSAVKRMSYDGAYIHLGASDEAEEGKWVWNDGTPMSVDWFDTGEPDGGTAKNCLLVLGWKAHDTNCGHGNEYFLCEMTKNGSATIRFLFWTSYLQM